MATFTLTKSGSWRAQVRRKGVYAGQSFLKKADAMAWAREAEVAIDKGLPVPTRGESKTQGEPGTLAYLIDLHIADMAELKRVMLARKTSCCARSGANWAQCRSRVSTANA